MCSEVVWCNLKATNQTEHAETTQEDNFEDLTQLTMTGRFSGSYYEASPELRLVLLGNIGCGKTSSGDTILNQQSSSSHFESRSSQLRQGFSEGRKVTVVEAPRWYWNGSIMEDHVRKATERAVKLVAPGPHAVLLLIPVSQFTQLENRVPAELEKVFGEEVFDHTLVLLTCGDYLMGRTVEEYLQNEHSGLRQIIDRCNGRYHVFNNRKRQDREQVRQLLEKVDTIVHKSGLLSLKSAEDRELDRRIKERKQELLESYRAQREEQRESMASLYTTNTQTQPSTNPVLERLSEEQRDETNEDGVDVTDVSDGLHSTQNPQKESQPADRELKRTPSFRLTADGAVLSQMSEAKRAPKITTTFHQRVNSVEDRSPEVSPTSSSYSSVFSSGPSSPAFTSSFTSSSPELRLVLVGRSGAGKSAAGNLILGREEFRSHDSLTAITHECEKKKAVVAGRRVAVVDTPDWFCTEKSPEEVQAQISSCVALSSPGPHAFLLCVPVDQPAKTELQALAALEVVFGAEAVQKHTLILFTYADRLRESGKAGNKNVEAYIASQRADLVKLVEMCRDRFHVMETVGGEMNVAELLEKVEQTVKEAGGECYSSPAFQEAEDRVRQRQLVIAREQRRVKAEKESVGVVGPLGSERRGVYPYMQPVEEEELSDDEIDKTRDEAEISVSTMKIESLPSVTLSDLSPSLLQSVRETIESSVKMLPKLLADGSVWVGEGANKVKSSPVWGTVSSRAQNVQKMVVDSSVWGKVGAGAGHVSKYVGERVPKVVVDGSTWVGSGAKAAAASPMWGKVGSGAKSGAKLVAESSMRVGSEIGSGAKKLAQNPMWGKVGSGAKARAKMVVDSPVWEKIGNTAKQIPMVVIGGAVLGLVLGVFFGGVIGGAVGAAAGSVASEVGRRKFSAKNSSEKTDDAVKNAEGEVNDGIDSLLKRGAKGLKVD